MRAFGMIAAIGLMAATVGVGTISSADAKPRHGDRGWHGRHDEGRHWRGDRWHGRGDYWRDGYWRGNRWRGDYGWRRHYGWRGDHGWRPRYGWRGYHRCWTEWRPYYRVRVCR